MANYTIDSMTYGSNTYTFTIPYGTCGVNEDVKGKAVTCANFTKLETGARIAVKFTNGNTHTSPVLNVNNTGAKSIVHPSSNYDITDAWRAGSIIDFVYDGTSWVIAGHLPSEIHTRTLTTSHIVNDGETVTQCITAEEGSIDYLYSTYDISCGGTISADVSMGAPTLYEGGTELEAKYSPIGHTHTFNYSYDASTGVLTISN